MEAAWRLRLPNSKMIDSMQTLRFVYLARTSAEGCGLQFMVEIPEGIDVSACVCVHARMLRMVAKTLGTLPA